MGTHLDSITLLLFLEEDQLFSFMCMYRGKGHTGTRNAKKVKLVAQKGHLAISGTITGYSGPGQGQK